MDQPGRLVLMMMTPLEPRTPYSAVSAGSLRTSIDSMSLGLTPVRYPLGPGSIATPSRTYKGVLPLLIDEPPRMRTAKPPSGVRVTSTPGKRPISTCSIDCPGALAMSSAVTVELGDAVGAGAAAASTGLFRCEQPEPSPMRKLTGSKARIENEVIGLLPWHATLQYTTWNGSRLTPSPVNRDDHVAAVFRSSPDPDRHVRAGGARLPGPGPGQRGLPRRPEPGHGRDPGRRPHVPRRPGWSRRAPALAPRLHLSRGAAAARQPAGGRHVDQHGR